VKIIHVELNEANTFVALHHRHHKPVVGHRFSIGLMDYEKLVGVAIIGRPVARMTDQKNVVEVTRLRTDGTPMACSALYGAAARAANALGYQRIQTFILESETGVSLAGAGWKRFHTTAGGDGWQSRDGRRQDQPTEPKVLYARDFDFA
jgi:hypothetical protein